MIMYACYAWYVCFSKKRAAVISVYTVTKKRHIPHFTSDRVVYEIVKVHIHKTVWFSAKKNKIWDSVLAPGISQVRFDEFQLAEWPLARGHWCPYCEQQSQLNTQVDESFTILLNERQQFWCFVWNFVLYEELHFFHFLAQFRHREIFVFGN